MSTEKQTQMAASWNQRLVMPETTEDTLKARVRETPLLDRLMQCRDRIGKMCSERRGPRMCIPVLWNDDDFFIATTLEDAADVLRHNIQTHTTHERH